MPISNLTLLGQPVGFGKYLPILGKANRSLAICNGKIKHFSFPSFRSKGILQKREKCSHKRSRKITKRSFKWHFVLAGPTWGHKNIEKDKTLLHLEMQMHQTGIAIYEAWTPHFRRSGHVGHAPDTCLTHKFSCPIFIYLFLVLDKRGHGWDTF